MILMSDKKTGWRTMYKKSINVLIVFLLLVSVFSIVSQTASAQPYDIDVYPTGPNGNSKSYYLEGQHVFFTIELNESVSEDVTVRLRDNKGVPLASKTVTTNQQGLYHSWQHEEYFETTDRRAGTYYLNISSPEGTYNNGTFQVVSNYYSGSSISTWDDDYAETPPGERKERTNFVKEDGGFFQNGRDVYLNATIEDAYGNPLENDQVTIELEHNGDTMDQNQASTDEQGELSSSVFLEWGDSLGSYNVTIYYRYDQFTPPEQKIVAQKNIYVYEPDYTQNSQITLPDHYVQKSGEVQYKVQVRDQYGWAPPQDNTGRNEVDIWVKKGNKVDKVRDNRNLGENGEYEGYFVPSYELDFEEISGDYTLYLYDGNSFEESQGDINGTMYAMNTFTVFYLEITVSSEQGVGQVFTQGQNIEITVESNLPDNIDVSIMNETYWQMPGAIWSGMEMTNGRWSADYNIPNDVPDGEYFVYVNSSESDNLLAKKGIEVKKFTLDLKTDQTSYLPGETVRAFYTVSNNLDGSEVSSAVVDWRAAYLNESGGYSSITGSTQQGAFSFTIPKTAALSTYTSYDFYIEAWANDTQGHTDHEILTDIALRDITTQMSLSSFEYVVGETVYVNTWTHYAPYEQTPIKDAEVTVQLLKSGVVLEDYTVTANTDRGGEATLPLELLSDLDSGTYTIRVNATKYDSFDVQEQNITVISELTSLSILTETNKPRNQYYQGDRLQMNYTVTKQGDVVDAEVKYQIEATTNSVVYEYRYASGGSISFEIPQNFDTDDSLKVTLWAYHGQKGYGKKEMSIPVKEGLILFNVDQETYSGSENITFSYELKGIDNPRSLQYKISDSQGGLTTFGEPTDGEFTFEVPSNPTNSYLATLEVVTSGNKKMTDTIEINKERGYRLELSIATESRYTTDVYKPDQKIKVKYKVVTLGDSSKPEHLEIHYGLARGENYTLETDETEGTFSLKLPKNADGSYFIYASAGSGMYKTEELSVEKDPSWAQKKSVGGMSQANLLLLAIALIALIIAVIAVLMNQDMMPVMGTTGKKRKISKRGPEEEEEEKKPHEWSGPVKGETSEEEAEESSEEQSDEEDKGKKFEWDKKKDGSQIEPDEPKW